MATAGRLRAKGGWKSAAAGTEKVAERIHEFAIALIFIAIGITVTAFRQPSATTGEIRNHAWCAGIVKDTRPGAAGTRMEVRLSVLAGPDGRETQVRNVDVHLTADSSAARPGDVIVWRNRLAPVTATGNRQGDVWPEILRMQGVLYRQHLSPSDYQVTGTVKSLDVIMAGVRDDQRALLENSRLSDAAAALTAAIITGDRQALPSSTMEDFRLTGLSHILALSGLHIGMLASLLLFMLLPLHLLPGHSAHKFRRVIAALLLWGYAIFTGSGAPVVRACVMTTVLFLAGAAERPYRSGNALAAAALVVLLSDPLQLFQPGFQLSFLITALILAAVRPMNGDSRGRNCRVLDMFRRLSLVVTAMIGSWLLTAFHFHSLPLGSLPWNLLVSMVLPAYFIAAVLYGIMLATGCDPLWAATVVDGLAKAVLWCGNHPEASIPVWLNGFAALAAGMALAAFTVWLHIHRRKWLTASAAALVTAVWCVIFLPSGKPADGFIVLDHTVRHTDSQHLNAIRIYADGRDSLLLLPRDTTMMFDIHGQRLLLLDSPRLPADTVDCRLLLVGAGFDGTPDLTHIRPDTILLLPGIPRYAAGQWPGTTLAPPPVLDLGDNGPYPSFRAM